MRTTSSYSEEFHLHIKPWLSACFKIFSWAFTTSSERPLTFSQKFIFGVSKKAGSDHEPISLRGFLSSIQRYLNKQNYILLHNFSTYSTRICSKETLRIMYSKYAVVDMIQRIHVRCGSFGPVIRFRIFVKERTIRFRIKKPKTKWTRKLRNDRTMGNHTCLTARLNTLNWLVKNDITHVWIEMISSLVGKRVYRFATTRYTPNFYIIKLDMIYVYTT